MDRATPLPTPVPARHTKEQFITDSTPKLKAAHSSKPLTCYPSNHAASRPRRL